MAGKQSVPVEVAVMTAPDQGEGVNVATVELRAVIGDGPSKPEFHLVGTQDHILYALLLEVRKLTDSVGGLAADVRKLADATETVAVTEPKAKSRGRRR